MSLEDQLKKAGFTASASPDKLAANAGSPSSGAPGATSRAAGPTFGPKVVVRWGKLEKGGRAVTSVAGITSGRDQVADALKKALGIGARVDGELVVLQGDQVDRACAWLEKQGVKKIVRGS
jgi:translation initiation factor 1 (eIF-1/SUI1)